MRALIIKRIILGIVVVLLLLFLLVSGVEYMSTTCSPSKVKEYCLLNTKANAHDFFPSSVSKLEGYMFWVAEGEAYQQELFIFQKKALWGIIDLDRYTLVQHITGSENHLVSSVRFEAKGNLAETETTVVLFFSSNLKNITYYKVELQENGMNCELKGSVAREEPFVIGITEIGNNEYINRTYDRAEFYDEKYHVLEIEE